MPTVPTYCKNTEILLIRFYKSEYRNSAIKLTNVGVKLPSGVVKGRSLSCLAFDSATGIPLIHKCIVITNSYPQDCMEMAEDSLFLYADDNCGFKWVGADRNVMTVLDIPVRCFVLFIYTNKENGSVCL